MGSDCNICSNKCWGLPGNHGSCCSLENRDFIIGPHPDSYEFIDRLSKKLGRQIEHQEVFVNYEEGKNLFPDKPVWQNPNSYPALRVNYFDPKLPCIFYNTKIKSCMVYDIRPQTCQDYECNYLKEQTELTN